VIEHELSDADSEDNVHSKSYVPLVPPSLHVIVPVGVAGVPLVSVTVAVAVVTAPITREGVLTVTPVVVGDANARDEAEKTSRNASGDTRVMILTAHSLCDDPSPGWLHEHRRHKRPYRWATVRRARAGSCSRP
jgi:hypothetical protein